MVPEAVTSWCHTDNVTSWHAKPAVSHPPGRTQGWLPCIISIQFWIHPEVGALGSLTHCLFPFGGWESPQKMKWSTLRRIWRWLGGTGWSPIMGTHTQSIPMLQLHLHKQKPFDKRWINACNEWILKTYTDCLIFILHRFLTLSVVLLLSTTLWKGVEEIGRCAYQDSHLSNLQTAVIVYMSFICQSGSQRKEKSINTDWWNNKNNYQINGRSKQ